MSEELKILKEKMELKKITERFSNNDTKTKAIEVKPFGVTLIKISRL